MARCSLKLGPALEVLQILSRDLNPAHIKDMKWAHDLLQLLVGPAGFVKLVLFAIDTDFAVAANTNQVPRPGCPGCFPCRARGAAVRRHLQGAIPRWSGLRPRAERNVHQPPDARILRCFPRVGAVRSRAADYQVRMAGGDGGRPTERRGCVCKEIV